MCNHHYLPSKDPMVVIGGIPMQKTCIYCEKPFKAHGYVKPQLRNGRVVMRDSSTSRNSYRLRTFKELAEGAELTPIEIKE